MKLGVDYYPANRDNWQRDAELMAKAGVKMIRVGKNSWCRFEPRQDEFDFEIYDELIPFFAKYGIGTVIYLPIGNIPRWLNNDGCLSSEKFISRSSKLINEISKHFSENKAIIGWHIDSLKSEGYTCFCDECNKVFINWLKDKYDTLEQLNNEWGTVRDGREYTEWEQISLNEKYEKNSTFLLERECFFSERNREYINYQVSVIRKNIPKANISVSIYPENFNPYSETESVDMVYCEVSHKTDEFDLDFIRGIKKFGVSFNFENHNPNTLKGYALQSFLHGADVVFYRWQMAVSGSETNYFGLLNHCGMPTRNFFEFSELYKILRFENINEINSNVAILFSPESAFDIKSIDYVSELKRIYKIFRKYGANVDIISCKADFSGYSVVIVPYLCINDKKTSENIYRYVINGGTLIMTARSGLKNFVGRYFEDPFPSIFRELIGAEVTEYDAISESVNIRDYSGKIFECSKWCDVLKISTAKTYAVYESGAYSGLGVITVNDYCKGKAYYIGTVPDDNFYADFIGKLLKYHSIPHLSISQSESEFEDVEISTITGGSEKFLTFFNNSADTCTINLPKPLYSIVDGRGKDNIVLEPYTIDIFKK